MEDWFYTLYERYKLYYCVECGKCVAVCPMQDIFRRFDYEISPRGIIKKAALHLDILHDKAIWFCQECTACTETCPAGVEYEGFISSLREIAVERGIVDSCSFCARCGVYYLPIPTLENMKGILEEKHLSNEYLNLCPRCRRYELLKTKLGTTLY